MIVLPNVAGADALIAMVKVPVLYFCIMDCKAPPKRGRASLLNDLTVR